MQTPLVSVLVEYVRLLKWKKIMSEYYFAINFLHFYIILKVDVGWRL